MEFVRSFNVRKGRESEVGSLRIVNGYLRIRINVPNAHIVKFGATKKGLGCVIQTGDKDRKTPYVSCHYKYEEDWIPANFQGKGYIFSIPANKVSETEYEFLFCNAKMKNKK